MTRGCPVVAVHQVHAGVEQVGLSGTAANARSATASSAGVGSQGCRFGWGPCPRRTRCRAPGRRPCGWRGGSARRRTAGPVRPAVSMLRYVRLHHRGEPLRVHPLQVPYGRLVVLGRVAGGVPGARPRGGLDDVLAVGGQVGRVAGGEVAGVDDGHAGRRQVAEIPLVGVPAHDGRAGSPVASAPRTARPTPRTRRPASCSPRWSGSRRGRSRPTRPRGRPSTRRRRPPRPAPPRPRERAGHGRTRTPAPPGR